MSGGIQKVVGPVAMAPMKPSRSPKKGCEGHTVTDHSVPAASMGCKQPTHRV